MKQMKVDWTKVVVKADLDYAAKKSQAWNYLGQTDWYIIRFLEEGIPVPEDVARQRKEAKEILRKEPDK